MDKQTEIRELRSLCQTLLSALTDVNDQGGFPELAPLIEQAEKKLDTSGRHCWLDEDPDESLPCECVFDNEEPLENCCYAMKARHDSRGKYSCPYYSTKQNG